MKFEDSSSFGDEPAPPSAGNTTNAESKNETVYRIPGNNRISNIANKILGDLKNGKCTFADIASKAEEYTKKLGYSPEEKNQIIQATKSGVYITMATPGQGRAVFDEKAQIPTGDWIDREVKKVQANMEQKRQEQFEEKQNGSIGAVSDARQILSEEADETKADETDKADKAGLQELQEEVEAETLVPWPDPEKAFTE